MINEIKSLTSLGYFIIMQFKKMKLSVKILIGLVLILCAIIALNISLFKIQDSSKYPATEKISPVLAKLEGLGGGELCKREHSGVQSFNESFTPQKPVPMIEVFYKFTDAPADLKEILVRSLQEIGYPVTEDVKEIAEIKQRIKDGLTFNTDYNDETDLMQYSGEGTTVSLRIFRNIKDITGCRVDKGIPLAISVTGKEALVSLQLMLPERQN